jgi:hypothetical protein
MAEKHPYLSGNAGLVQAVNQLRKSFPSQVSADTLKKLGIAPKNESLVMNILRFIGLVDAEGKKAVITNKVFSAGDPEFQVEFGELVKKAYKDLFDLYSDATWKLPQDKLVSFFRSTDHTSAITGQRQASTLQTLAGLSGQTEINLKTPSASAAKPSTPKTKSAKKEASKVVQHGGTPPSINGDPSAKSGAKDVGLTVRIEVNLPAGADQDTYDRIFKSIRENLLNG